MSEFRKIVVVGGCGHVGLPFGLVLAKVHPCEVILLDIDQRKVDQVNNQQPPFLETGLEGLLCEVVGKNARATTDGACLEDADVAITVVGTPIDEHLNPTVNGLIKNVEEVVNRLPDGALLILRSTIYPGCTEIVHNKIRAMGRRIHVAFCPERIAEGKALEELVELPQIISAFDDESLHKARALFSKVACEIIEVSPLEAELAKLFTNSWRYLNFAISNQFYVMCEAYGVDFYRIYNAVTHRYPRMKAFARAGFAAGPCLLKDTMQLSAFANNNFFLGHAAMLVNEGLPKVIVESLISEHGLTGKTVAVLGMAFKGNSDDPRDSLSYKLKRLLELHAARVLCTDPFVQDDRLVPLADAIAEADVIVLGAPHDEYRGLEFAGDKIVVDCWGFWPRAAVSSAAASRVGERV